MSSRALLRISLIVSMAACASPAAQGEPQPVTLTVFAAASLTGSFTEIGKDFEADHPGVTVVFNFAGSQQLSRQLADGASADVFASADTRQMDTAIQAGRVAGDAPKTFARNRLVVIVPQDNPADLHTLKDLARPGLRLVLAAKEVPVGQYTLDFLGQASRDTAFGATFGDDVLKNVVSYEENVRAVLSKVALGEADAGIVYASDVRLHGADEVRRIDIPEALNTIATYPIAPVIDSAQATRAQAFVDWVLGPKGQAVLEQYGFIGAEP